jgi:hypothetical protein
MQPQSLCEIEAQYRPRDLPLPSGDAFARANELAARAIRARFASADDFVAAMEAEDAARLARGEEGAIRWVLNPAAFPSRHVLDAVCKLDFARHSAILLAESEQRQQQQCAAIAAKTRARCRNRRVSSSPFCRLHVSKETADAAGAAEPIAIVGGGGAAAS